MHACCILHKLFAGQHMKTSRLWGIGGIWVLIGSLIELSVMAVLWHAFWYAWDVPTKVIMVVLHFGECRARVDFDFSYLPFYYSLSHSQLATISVSVCRTSLLLLARSGRVNHCLDIFPAPTIHPHRHRPSPMLRTSHANHTQRSWPPSSTAPE